MSLKIKPCICINYEMCGLYDLAKEGANVKTWLNKCPCKLCLKNPVCRNMCDDLREASDSFVDAKNNQKIKERPDVNVAN